MEIIRNIAGTAISIFVALAAWVAFQGFIRRGSGCKRDRDVLEFMAHGCAGCKGDGACKNRKAEEQHQ